MERVFHFVEICGILFAVSLKGYPINERSRGIFPENSMEINKATANPAVKAAVEAFIKEQTPRHELDMLTALMRARFMSPVVFSNPVEDGKVPADTKVQQCYITNKDGEHFYIAFTDEEMMKKWLRDQKFDFVLLNLAQFLALLNREQPEEIKGIVVNPMTHNLTLTKEMLLNLPKRHQQLLRSVPPRFLLGRPKEEPQQLEDVLSKYFKKKQREVKEAWMLMALREGTKKPRLMLVVDYDGVPEDAKELFPAIIDEVKPYLSKDEGMDIVRRDGKFGEDVLAKTEPFYQRKNSLFW